MWQYLLVAMAVATAGFVVVRRIVRIVTGREKNPCAFCSSAGDCSAQQQIDQLKKRLDKPAKPAAGDS